MGDNQLVNLLIGLVGDRKKIKKWVQRVINRLVGQLV